MSHLAAVLCSFLVLVPASSFCANPLVRLKVHQAFPIDTNYSVDLAIGGDGILTLITRSTVEVRTTNRYIVNPKDLALLNQRRSSGLVVAADGMLTVTNESLKWIATTNRVELSERDLTAVKGRLAALSLEEVEQDETRDFDGSTWYLKIATTAVIAWSPDSGTKERRLESFYSFCVFLLDLAGLDERAKPRKPAGRDPPSRPLPIDGAGLH